MTSTTSIGGNSAKPMPGSLTRFGPTKRNGDARFDHTGSSRMLRPGGLNKPAGMADIGNAPRRTFDARRRTVGKRRRRPGRPFRPVPRQ